MRDYRKFYEQKLKVKLQRGASIHHIDSNHKNNSFANLVAIDQETHNQYNILRNKFPRLLYRLCKRLPFVLSNKVVKELLEYGEIYKKLNIYIEIKNSIKRIGLEETIKIYPITNDLYKGLE